MKKRIYHREKCSSCIRKISIINNRLIILEGTHAFEYSVTIINSDKSHMKIIQFSNRCLAYKEYAKYIKNR